MHPGVYAVLTGTPRREALRWAAVLWAGPGAMLSYAPAAELDGMIAGAGSVIHLTISGYRRIGKRCGLVVHVSDRAAAARHPSRLPPRTRIEETVLDLVAHADSVDDAIGWLTKAPENRLTTQAKLREALAQRRRMPWRREISQLLRADMKGVLFVLEYRYVRDVERPHGLPSGERQALSQVNGHRQYQDVKYKRYRWW